MSTIIAFLWDITDTLASRPSKYGMPTLDSVDGDLKLALSKEGAAGSEARLPDSEATATKSKFNIIVLMSH